MGLLGSGSQVIQYRPSFFRCVSFVLPDCYQLYKMESIDYKTRFPVFTTYSACRDLYFFILDLSIEWLILIDVIVVLCCTLVGIAMSTRITIERYLKCFSRPNVSAFIHNGRIVVG